LIDLRGSHLFRWRVCPCEMMARAVSPAIGVVCRDCGSQVFRSWVCLPAAALVAGRPGACADECSKPKASSLQHQRGCVPCRLSFIATCHISSEQAAVL
jgi:hypothetical protein